MVAWLLNIPVISFPEVHAAGSNSSLIGNLETIVNSVNYNDDIDAVYQGMIVGETTMQQLINAYNALTNATLILQWTPILSKLGYVDQTTIEWALDNQQMMSDGLPNTGTDSLSGASQSFFVYDRFLILAYGYAIQYDYDLATWNLTQAYNSFKASVDSATYPALLWVDQNGAAQSISYGPRYYDECGETIDCFLDFYNLGITTALNDSLATWLWANNNLWSGTHYNYALNWAGYECEAGGFLQIALKLWHADPSSPDTQNLLVDIENRFLQEQFFSPQWLDGVVVHMATDNLQLRLENTVMAWAAILGVYGELNSTYQTDVQDMLTGASPAWLELLQSPLWTGGLNNDATATGADLVFMLGIVPQTAVLAVPVEENSYEYVYNILDPELFNINLNTNVVTVSLAAPGTLNFQFNQKVTESFSKPGIYTVRFSSDWNTVLSTAFVSALPLNRQYVYTTFSNYIAASAGADGVISPAGNVSVDYGGSQSFAITADVGYHVADVIVDGVSQGAVSSYVFTNVQAAHVINASFAIDTFMIAASAGADGVISPAGNVSVDYGGSQSFAITADVGYHVADVIVDGVSQGAVSSYVFTNVQAAHVINASFAIDTFMIAASAGADGVISPAGNVSVDYGGSQSFAITADVGYHVADVIVDGVSQGAVSSYVFTNVQAAHVINASFAIDTFMIAASAGADGVISPAGNVSVDYGGSQSFAITANIGYYIVNVKVNGSSVGAVSSYTFSNAQAAYTISATFALAPIIYGIAVTLAIVAIVAVVLVLRKRKKGKG